MVNICTVFNSTFCLHCNGSCKEQQPPFPMAARAVFPIGKRLWTWRSPHTSRDEVMVQWSCNSIAPYVFMACTLATLPLSAFPHTALTGWFLCWRCGRAIGNEFFCVLFGRDSCRGVLKSKSFATDNSLRDLSEHVHHPCRHFQLSDIYIILYLMVIVTYRSSSIRLFTRVAVYFTCLSVWLETDLNITEMKLPCRFTLHIALTFNS